jgi:hypothetical protein
MRFHWEWILRTWSTVTLPRGKSSAPPMRGNSQRDGGADDISRKEGHLWAVHSKIRRGSRPDWLFDVLRCGHSPQQPKVFSQERFMSGASARDGRRRRVLQEEVLSASREMPAYTGEDLIAENGEGRRYAIAPESLANALARRHFPSHWLIPAGMIAAATVVSATLVALDMRAGSLATQFSGQDMSIIELGRPGSLGNYLSSSAMLVSALAGTLVFAVRRQRVDDYRGKYRLWRSAIALFAVASLVIGTGLHRVFAGMMTHLTGTGLVGQGAGWWLLTAGIVSTIIAARVLLDVRESRLAMVPLAVACGALVVSVVGVTGWLPSGSIASSVLKGITVWGYLMIPAGLVGYMRFLRQDVAAGVATPLRVTRSHESTPVREVAKPRVSTGEVLQIADVQDDLEVEERRSKPRKAKSQLKPAPTSRWTDGSDGDVDDYGDEGLGQGRKFNKADRKRMRREKEERRAA